MCCGKAYRTHGCTLEDSVSALQWDSVHDRIWFFLKTHYSVTALCSKSDDLKTLFLLSGVSDDKKQSQILHILHLRWGYFAPAPSEHTWFNQLRSYSVLFLFSLNELLFNCIFVVYLYFVSFQSCFCSVECWEKPGNIISRDRSEHLYVIMHLYDFSLTIINII